MNINKKFIKILLSTLIIPNFCFSVNALKMKKKDVFRPTEKMFNKSSLERNEIESFSITSRKKSSVEINGPTAQIFVKSFRKQLIKDFEKTNDFNITKNVDGNDLFSVKKENLKDKFVINIDFKKNVNSDIKNRFKNYINYISTNKAKLNDIAKKTKEDIKSNFEKYRKETIKDLTSLKNYHTNRRKTFNSAVNKKKNNFVKDFREFADVVAKSYEIYNKDEIKDERELHKIAKDMKKDANNLNLDSKIFKMYKKRILGPSEKEINKFSKDYKNVLSKIKKQNVINCCDNLVISGIQVNKY